MSKGILKVVGGVVGAGLGGLIGGPIGAIAGAGIGGSIGNAVGKGPKSAVAPTQAGAPVMPIADDQAVMRARKVSMLKQRSRGGRSSTILSQGSETLGGGYG